MNIATTWRSVGVASFAWLLAAGCTTSPATSLQVHTTPSVRVPSLAGGCAGTVISDAEPPVWAQGGWSVAKGTPWPVPWAIGTHNDTLAYLFGTQLVAGTQNKVLWKVKDLGANLLVEGHPLGKSQPVVTITGGPSITNVPAPGCWTFRLSWGSNHQNSSIINLEALAPTA